MQDFGLIFAKRDNKKKTHKLNAFIHMLVDLYNI